MPVNTRLTKPQWSAEHYQDDNIEHDLFNSVIVEYNDIQGVSVLYYIRDESIEMDTLYGESVNTAYLGPYSSKITYDVPEEPTITDPFGISSTDVIQWAYIPKTTFIRDISNEYNPKPGDVVKTLWNERSYEVADVNEENTIFHLKKAVWELVLRPYRFSDQSESAADASYDDDSTLSEPLTAWGDNAWLEEESDNIDDYSDVDESIYGF